MLKATSIGSAFNGGDLTCDAPYGCGTVFKLNPAGHLITLYQFQGGADGGSPGGSLTRAGGILYGATFGGASDLVFKVDAKGNKTTLYAFTGGADGGSPNRGLARDTEGNLYGTTSSGGNSDPSCEVNNFGCGTVFKIDSTGKETVLHAFTGIPDGRWPRSVIRDGKGNLYGITQEGGNTACLIGCGTVFKVDAAGNLSVLHTFTGGSDGGYGYYTDYYGRLVRSAGNLYGTTLNGGDLSCGGGWGCGVVFKINPKGKETVLHTFTGGSDGAEPTWGLVRDAAGNFYGTTNTGGANGFGTLFKLDSNGQLTTLYNFTLVDKGPDGELVLDSARNLYGATFDGGNPNCNAGSGCGTVFKVTP